MPEKRKKVAILLPRFPYPLDKGDKLRAFHQIREIARICDIHLFTLSSGAVKPDDLSALQTYCHSITIYKRRWVEILWNILISFIKGYPVQVGFYYSSRINQRFIKDLGLIQPDTVYCQLSRTALYGKKLPYRKVIDLQDAFSMNYQRIQSSFNGFKRFFYQREASLMKNFEQRMINWFDEAIIISAYDKQAIGATGDSLHVVSNGVDTEHFKRQPLPVLSDLLFSGNLSYLPNIHAVHFLLDEIAPLLVQQRPEIKIRIVGPSGYHFNNYASKNIRIDDWIDDIRVAYNETRLFIAPLFTGAGLQNKLLEAMSMSIPCITSKIANASLQAKQNEEIMIADSAEEFVNKVIELLDDSELTDFMSKQARAFVQQKYNWTAETDKLIALLSNN